MTLGNAPIFIIGTERSGSNLLRLILDAHPEIRIPHPPHLMNYFSHLDYGNLQDAKRMKALLKDMVAFIGVHIFPWDRVNLWVDELYDSLKLNSHYGAVEAIYRVDLKASSKKRWGCKSTFMIHHVDAILDVSPKAQFIHLVRDPRDVALSASKSVFSPFHPYFNAQLWSIQQQEAISLSKRLKSHSFTTLRYEDLLTNPNRELKSLCHFLMVDFNDEMLQFFKGEEADKSAGLSESWGNTNRPIIKDNFGKYKGKIIDSDLKLIEAICHDGMTEFNYDFEFPNEADVDLSNLDILKFKVSNFKRKCEVEWRSLNRDDNHWRRWRRDAQAIYLNMKRPSLK